MAAEGPQRVVLVTGGAQGIGLAVARVFRAQGDTVAVLDRQETVHEKAAEIGAESFVADASDAELVGSVVDQLVHRHGAVDVLVNCAGVMLRKGVEETSIEDWAAVTAANLTSVFVCSRAVLPVMRARGGGNIVSIGSIWATRPWADRAAYAATKAAVEHFTRCLALEVVADGVRVNCVSPGLVRTALTERVLDDPAFVASFMPRVTLGRAAEVEEVAQLVAFVASSASSYLSGEVLMAHGGYH